jgi:hypothetical protein
MGINETPTSFYELNLRGYAGPAEEILPKVAKKIERPPPLLAIVIDPTYKLMGTWCSSSKSSAGAQRSGTRQYLIPTVLTHRSSMSV